MGTVNVPDIPFVGCKIERWLSRHDLKHISQGLFQIPDFKYPTYGHQN